MYARSFRNMVVGILTALTLSGCIGRGGPVASGLVAAPVGYSDLDSMAYRREAPAAYAPTPVAYEAGYRLDAGDRLRIVVYGQEGLTNTYSVDAGGMITMPLIGAVQARGLTPAGLAKAVAAKLRNGYIREPYVAAEVDAYRPFYILGEVAAPGQYPYVPNMTVESAIAIAGGFSPRALRTGAQLTRSNEAGSVRSNVPVETPLQPGDTILIGERWF